MPDALVGVGGNGEATLVIANAGTQPVLLEEGDIIGMALQELDLDIQCCPGKTNSRADALSRHPVPLQPDNCTKRQTPALIDVIEAPLSSAQSRECDSDRISLSGAEPPSGPGPPDSTAAPEKESEGIEQISGVRSPKRTRMVNLWMVEHPRSGRAVYVQDTHDRGRSILRAGKCNDCTELCLTIAHALCSY